MTESKSLVSKMVTKFANDELIDSSIGVISLYIKDIKFVLIKHQ